MMQTTGVKQGVALSTFLTSRARIWLSRIVSLAFIVVIFAAESVWKVESPILAQALVAIGFTLVGLGVIGRVWAGSYICGKKNQTLVDFGPYSVTRNPLYFFSFVGMLGITLIPGTITLPIAYSIVFFAYYIPVMRKEERHLRSIHGTAFDAFAARVPLFWPQFSLFVEPQSYEVFSKFYRRFLSEVVWFVIGAAIVNFVVNTDGIRVLPFSFSLY